MILHSHVRLCFVVLLGMSVLGVRVTGLHTHLCRDGQEAPTAVHLVDAGVHDEHAGSEQDHQDVDVPAADALAKNAKSDSDSSFAITDLGARLAVLSRDHDISEFLKVPALRAAARYLLPPLRGPPL